MFLSSITIKGFKSFPDRTRLEFGPGVSVIVGPNGSGKSNITDAVLWALGEQSPVAVRGQSMQDVIFAGAPGRKASSAAEVELVIDDRTGSLGLGVPEVSIVRRLDRSGEGEYRLAGARCRLVDVIEVLSDTGLGKEMHSVISQGRVESLVTSKPRDRRLLIEEAAGLGKHRKRRRRAALKLERTQDNLDRALDVEREARSRLRPLKRQAEAAELHARLERQSLEARWELVRDELRAHLAALAQAQVSSAEARAAREGLERELADVAARRETAEVALAGRSAHREELSRRCFAARAAADRIADRVTEAERALERIEQRAGRSRELLAGLPDDMPEAAPDAAAMSRIAELERALAVLETERERAVGEQLEALELELRQATQLGEQLAGAEGTAMARRRQAETYLDQARSAVREAERAVEATRREAARVGGELAAVNHYLAGHAATPGSPTLADHLEVEPGFEVAVAAALEGRIRAAVVSDRAQAEAVLDRAGADGGSALVIGLGRRAGPTGSAPSEDARRLAEHVRGSGEAAELAQALLLDVWVVESLETLPGAFEGVAVTPSGRVFSPRTGELRQAPAAGDERILAQRNLRDRLVGESEKAVSAELAAAAALESAENEYQRLDAEREQLALGQRAAMRDRDEAHESVRRLEAAIERRRSAPLEGEAEQRRRQLAAALDSERAGLERAAREANERRLGLERLRAAAAADEAALPELAALTAALHALPAPIAVQQEAFEQALSEDREAGDHVAAQLRACAQEEAALQTELHAAGETLTEAEVGLQRARDRADSCLADLEVVAAKLELAPAPADGPLADDERQALTARLERLARRREQLGPVNPLAQEEYAEAVEHVEELEHQRSDLETALKELERLIADTDRQIRETFEQTFAAAARNFEQVAAHLFPGGSGRLRLVAEKDGPARVLGGAAVPEDDDADADAHDASEPEDDAGEEELLGVEIEINPAGKEMRRLSLLSGGEKSMTALAFLFAVFLARPCPFYILDEVEAALDDVNIDRFLGLLRSYSQHAQFIVVTHQKRTMEAADFLYGVSMGGDGISKVISRRLTDAQAA